MIPSKAPEAGKGGGRNLKPVWLEKEAGNDPQGSELGTGLPLAPAAPTYAKDDLDKYSGTDPVKYLGRNPNTKHRSLTASRLPKRIWKVSDSSPLDQAKSGGSAGFYHEEALNFNRGQVGQLDLPQSHSTPALATHKLPAGMKDIHSASPESKYPLGRGFGLNDMITRSLPDVGLGPGGRTGAGPGTRDWVGSDDERFMRIMSSGLARVAQNTPRLWRTPTLKRRPMDPNLATLLDGGVPMALKHPSLEEMDEDGTTARMLMEDWMASFAPGQFTSEAIYLESKLCEGLRVTDGMEVPNRLRTAMCCHVLDVIIQQMKYYKPVMNIIQVELCRSIFYDPNGTFEDIVGRSLAAGGGNGQPIVPVHVYLDSRPFYVQIATMKEKLDSVAGEFEKLKKDHARAGKVANMKERSMKNIMSAWMSNYLAFAFARWRQEVLKNARHRQAVQQWLSRWNARRNLERRSYFFFLWWTKVWRGKFENSSALNKQQADRIAELEKALKDANDALDNKTQENKTLDEENERLRAQLDGMVNSTAGREELNDAVGRLASAEARAEVAQQRAEAAVSFADKIAEAALTAPASDLADWWQCMPSAQRLLELQTGRVDPTRVKGRLAQAADQQFLKRNQSKQQIFSKKLNALKGARAAMVDDEDDDEDEDGEGAGSGSGSGKPTPRSGLGAELQESLQAEPDEHRLKLVWPARMADAASDMDLQQLWPANALDPHIIPGSSEPFFLQSAHKRLGFPSSLDMEQLHLTSLELDNLAVDEMVLRWVNVRLAELKAKTLASGFNDDFADVGLYTLLIQAVVEPGMDTGLQVLDPERRFTRLEAAAKTVGCGQFVSLSSIIEGKADLNAGFLSRLFMLPTNPEYAKKNPPAAASSAGQAQQELEQASQEFAELRNRWPEIKALLKTMVDPKAEVLPPEFRQGVGQAEELVKQYSKTTALLAAGCTWARDANRRWTGQVNRAMGYAWEVLKDRVHNKQLAVTDEHEVKENLLYATVYASKMKDVFVKEGVADDQAQATLENLRAVLSTNTRFIKQVFRHYAASAGSVNCLTMTCADFRSMIRDCQLQDKKLTATQVDLIFQVANRDPDEEEEQEEEEQLASANNPDREFVPEEFVEALIRVAALKYQGKPLWERLQALIDDPLKSFAGRCDTEVFRGVVREDETQQVLRKHKVALERIFAYYAASDGVVGIGTMSTGEFRQYLEDCKCFSDAFTDTAMNIIFANVQDGRGSGDDDDEDEAELNFGEFLEATCALIPYKSCNPYQPFSQRLDHFLKKTIIPLAKQAKLTTAQQKKPESKAGGSKISKLPSRNISREKSTKDAVKDVVKDTSTFMKTGASALKALGGIGGKGGGISED